MATTRSCALPLSSGEKVVVVLGGRGRRRRRKEEEDCGVENYSHY